MNAYAGPLAALTASLTWVVGSSVYSQLSRRFSPAAVNFNRALVALPLFLTVSLVQRDAVVGSLQELGPAIWSRVLWLGVSIFSSYSFGDVLFLWASLALGFPIAQAIGALYPVWAATAGWIFLGESLTTQKAFGMALAVLGTMVVVLLGARQEKKEKPPAHLPFLARYEVGVALALVASLAWAVNSFATGRGGQSMNAAFANVLRMSLALGLCGSLARWQGGKEARLFFDSADYLRYAPFFAIEAFLGSYLYMYGLSHSSVAVGATLSSLAPVASVPVAVFLGWEKFSGKTLLAMVVVVAGVVLLVA